jgi:hypothetical protein
VLNTFESRRYSLTNKIVRHTTPVPTMNVRCLAIPGLLQAKKSVTD